jgi:hypothetical protein
MGCVPEDFHDYVIEDEDRIYIAERITPYPDEYFDEEENENYWQELHERHERLRQEDYDIFDVAPLDDDYSDDDNYYWNTECYHFFEIFEDE